MISHYLFRKDFFIPFLLFLAVLAVYSFTMSPYVMMEDDGLFIITSYFNGVAHPPGYPLFTLIGYFFTQFEISTIAARVHFVSALFGSLTVVFIYHIVKLLGGRELPALFAGLMLAFSREFWSQSIIAEVYTLNTALFFAVLLGVLWVFCRYRQGVFDERSERVLCLSACVYGLGLSNHWPLMILSSPGIFVLVLPFFKHFLRLFPKLFVSFLLGLTPYVWMYFFGSNQDDYIAFGKISNFNELIYYLSREGYSIVDNSGDGSWQNKYYFARFFVEELLSQFSLLGLCAVFAGLVIYARTHMLIMLSLLLTFLGGSFLLIAMLGFDYAGFYRILFSPYPLIAYASFSISLGLSLCLFMNVVSFKRVTCIFIAIPLALLLVNFFKVNDRNNDWAERYAHDVLDVLPKNSILFVSSDVDTAPIGYAHYIQGMRPDIALYNEFGILFNNRLIHPYKELTKKDEVIHSLVNQSTRPIYATQKLEVESLKQVNMGLLYKIGEKSDTLDLNELNVLYISRLSSNDKNLDWIDIHKYLIAQQISLYLFDTNKLSSISDKDFALLNSTVDARIDYFSHMIQRLNPLPLALIEQYIVYIDKNFDRILSSSSKALYWYSKAMLYNKQNRSDAEVIELLERSVRLSPKSNNKAIQPLFQSYVLNNEHEKIKALSKLTGVEFKY